MKLSRSFIQTDSSTPNAVCLQSPCNPTLKVANFPDSRHHITSVFLPPTLVFITPPSNCYSQCFWAFLFIPTSFFTLQTFSCLPPLHALRLPSPPLTSCQGPRDSLSCGIPAAVLMILPPGPDQPEKYSNHFSTEWELSPQRLCEMCVNLHVSAYIVHIYAWFSYYI